MQNNISKQTGPCCPALRFAWQGRRGRPQGSWLWLCHLPSCVKAAQPLSRFTEAPALSHATWQNAPTLRQLAKLSHAPARPRSVPGCTSNRLTRGIPQEELAAHQIQPGSDLQRDWGSTKGMNYGGKSHSENISKSAPISTPVSCILQVR